MNTNPSAHGALDLSENIESAPYPILLHTSLYRDIIYFNNISHLLLLFSYFSSDYASLFEFVRSTNDSFLYPDLWSLMLCCGSRPTLNQALADQRGSRHLQRPLVRALLAATYEYADLGHASQSQSRKYPLPRNGSVVRFPWKQIGTKQ
jgi:hypothetical protein